MFFAVFKKKCIDPSRIVFLDKVKDRVEHLDLYNLIDISLDTHPYSGTTTTFESLLMGVPVLTLTKPETHVSRVTGSILSQLGLDQFIVSDRKLYLSQLKKIAENKQMLNRNYRDKLLNSNLCDAHAFTKKLEEKLKALLY